MEKLGINPFDSHHPFKQESKTPSKIDRAANKIFDDYIESNGLNNSPPNPLIPEHLRLEKLRNDVKANLDSGEFDKILPIALDALVYDGKNLVEEAEYKLMCQQLSKIPAFLEKIGYEGPLEGNLQTMIQIPDSVINTIFTVAQKVESDKSIAIFSLLNALVPENPDYPYRLGLVAHTTNNLELALRAFKEAINIDDDFYEARIYLADCLAMDGKTAEAKDELNQIEFEAVEERWQTVITNLRQDLP